MTNRNSDANRPGRPVPGNGQLCSEDGRIDALKAAVAILRAADTGGETSLAEDIRRYFGITVLAAQRRAMPVPANLAAPRHPENASFAQVPDVNKLLTDLRT